jgi:dynein heavy chain
MLRFFQSMLEEKRRSLSSAAKKLRNGLFKIEDTKQEVETMRTELEEAQVKGNKYYINCDK